MELNKYVYKTPDDWYDVDFPVKHTFGSRWMNYFFNLAEVVASQSKDPSTKVGCVMVDTESKRVVATGYNGFPPGVRETEERWTRPVKYDFSVHAEANAIAAAARFGIRLTEATMFVTMHPCVECAKLIAAAGIRNIVYIDKQIVNAGDREWINHLANAQAIFAESKIRLCACLKVDDTESKPEPTFTWKCAVNDRDELESWQNQEIGDLCFVMKSKTLYMWNGMLWVVVSDYSKLCY